MLVLSRGKEFTCGAAKSWMCGWWHTRRCITRTPTPFLYMAALLRALRGLLMNYYYAEYFAGYSAKQFRY